MPSTSEAQAAFMKLCAHAPEKARGDCPPMKVAKEFAEADRRTAKMKAKARRAAMSGRAYTSS